MVNIKRNPATAATAGFDLIIIGGGIHGVMLSLEASARGLTSLLVEKHDFGNATSFNNLRILHGGLRYLQSMDLKRFRESVAERRWFMRSFPDLVEPLSCLMPLYGSGLHRRSVFGVALRLNDLLSSRRNVGLPEAIRLPRGEVVDAARTRALFPAVEAAGLQGGAIWYDAHMPHSQRVLMEALRWSVDLGATALNYVEARNLRIEDGRVAGIECVDRETGESCEFRAGTVINAAGPWCAEVADRFATPLPDIAPFSAAWNVLFERAALSPCALAVTARRPGAQTLFLCPFQGRLMAGTAHLPPVDAADRAFPAAPEIEGFIAEINEAVPGLELRSRDIRRVFAGFLPGRPGARNSLAVRETIVDHSCRGGPAGLYSTIGIKFTTARSVANRTLDIASRTRGRQALRGSWACRPLVGLDPSVNSTHEGWSAALESVIAEEAVCHLDDLVLRRTALWENPERALMLAPALCSLFGWDQQRTKAEIDRLTECLEPEGYVRQQCE